MARVIVVMGVSGVGKSTIGQALASRLGAEFAEGDRYHPEENVAKMRSGRPLDDADRGPWLDRLRAEIEAWLRDDREIVLTCSALKASYREHLAPKNQSRNLDDGTRSKRVMFVHLQANRDLIAERLSARRGHYMPATLLDSQLATLEPPVDAISIDATRSPDDIVAELVQRLNVDH